MNDKRKADIKGITFDKYKEFSDWYNDVVIKSGLAEHSPIKGCMVIKPHGYAIWEIMMKKLDKIFKESGVRNAYFPMFIPESFLNKEAEHFSGFVPEVAWIKSKEDTGENYALRPTSETIIYYFFSRWIRSWRDLPVKINQWCNIVRWETKVTKLFVRTREFLWQEGHTAHETKEEAESEARLRINQYREFVEKELAIPVLLGKKSKKETFAGADYTLTIESLMPDGRALQLGTSHFLGQNFSRAFNITFTDREEKIKHVWQTSWGVTTRLIGAVVMVHGDNKGLVLPPNIAPLQVVIVPIYKKENMEEVLKAARKLYERVRKKFRATLDDRNEYTPGWKFNDWELKGVPIRVEIGKREIEKGEVVLARRDTGERVKAKLESVEATVEKMLLEIQKNLFERAKKSMFARIVDAKNFDELKSALDEKKMVRTAWCGSEKCEEEIKEKTSADIRLIDKENYKGECVLCGGDANYLVYVAKAY